MADLTIERVGPLKHITLTRPEKRNALTREMFTAITEALSVEPEPGDRCVVIRAQGPAFCGGVDLEQRERNESAEGRSPLELLCAAVRAYPLPVIAAVQGHAVGAGFMFALHADFVIAAESALMGNGAVQMGLVPPWTLARRILERCGPALTAELLLLGDLVPARRLAEAHAIIAAVVPDALQETVERVADRVAANAPLSLRAIKATLGAAAFAEASHAHVQRLIVSAQQSEDALEGVRARRERRDPEFRGR